MLCVTNTNTSKHTSAFKLSVHVIPENNKLKNTLALTTTEPQLVSLHVINTHKHK